MPASDITRIGPAHSLSRLPLELVALVTQYLRVADALALASTCRQYYSSLTDIVYKRKMRYEVDGEAPLQWAVVKGVLATAERCLRLGANPNEHTAQNRDGLTSPLYSHLPHSRVLLIEAVNEGCLTMVQLLLAHGADPCSSDGDITPFTLTAAIGRLDLLRIMLSTAVSDADALRMVNTISCKGYTALHYASGLDHTAMVTFLLDRGARLDVRDGSGDTCLHKAIGASFPGTTALLLRAGADYMLVDYSGDDIIDKLCAPFRWAPKDALSTLAALLSFLQKPLLATKTGQSRLPEDLMYKLLISGHYDAIELALDAGVAVDARSPKYRVTALFNYAISQLQHNGELAEGEDPGDDNEAIVRLLIDHGADVDFRDMYHGRTPLMMAACAGRSDIVDALLSHGGADIEIRDKMGEMAYAYAARAGHHMLSSSLFDQHMIHCELAARPDEVEEELDSLDWSFADDL